METMAANLTLDTLQWAGPVKDVVLIGKGQSEMEDAARRGGAGAGPLRHRRRAIRSAGSSIAPTISRFAKRGVPVLLDMALAGAYDLQNGGREAGERWLERLHRQLLPPDLRRLVAGLEPRAARRRRPTCSTRSARGSRTAASGRNGALVRVQGGARQERFGARRCGKHRARTLTVTPAQQARGSTRDLKSVYNGGQAEGLNDRGTRMKRYLLAAASVAALVASPAAARDHSAYFGIEVGPMWAKDSHVVDDFGDGERGLLHRRPQDGVDGDLIAGYDFGIVRADEGGYKWAKHDKYYDDTDCIGADGHSRVYSIMGNAMVDLGKNEAVNFYAGGGVGIAWVREPASTAIATPSTSATAASPGRSSPACALRCSTISMSVSNIAISTPARSRKTSATAR